MEIDEWWPRLTDDAREALIADNGDVVPPEVVAAIVTAGGVLHAGEWWEGESGPDGLTLSDRAVDWIEEAANDER